MEISRLAQLALAVFMSSVTHGAETILPLEPNPSLPTIWIAGDSTAASAPGAGRQGWGVPFADSFDLSKVNIVNRAVAGRSSRTFVTEGLWGHLAEHIKPGDIVLIQFGHNDEGGINEEPPGSKLPLRARGSIPGLGEESQEIDNVVTKKHEVVHTYGWYLRKMIADTRSKHARPIVLSLTVRNVWTNGRVERGAGNFGAWARETARATGVLFIDLTNRVADRFEAMGAAQERAQG